MRAWLLKVGTPAIAVKFDSYGPPTMVEKTIKKEVMYFEQDVTVDPIGKFVVGPQQYNRRTMGI